jgi:hypothetical protein
MTRQVPARPAFPRIVEGSSILKFCSPGSRTALVLIPALIAFAAADAARAQGRLDARYVATLGGVSLGKGAWLVDIREDSFTSAISGATSGVLRLISSGRGSSASRGTVSDGRPTPSSYSSTIETSKKYDEVRMVLSGGNVKEFIAEPPNTPNPERIPISEAHRRGVQDPMTASILRVPGNGNTFVPQACNRTLPIFDGRMRYDLQLAFKRLDKVRSEKGYQGTVVVCSVHFLPIAGHVPDRAVIKYLTALRDIEIWLAPIAGTRLMVPYRISLSTPFGQGVVHATQFVSIPQTSSPKAAAKAKAKIAPGQRN